MRTGNVNVVARGIERSVADYWAIALNHNDQNDILRMIMNKLIKCIPHMQAIHCAGVVFTTLTLLSACFTIIVLFHWGSHQSIRTLHIAT